MGPHLTAIQPPQKMDPHKPDLSVPLSNPNTLCALLESNFLTGRETARLFFVTAKRIRMSVKEKKNLLTKMLFGRNAAFAIGAKRQPTSCWLRRGFPTSNVFVHWRTHCLAQCLRCDPVSPYNTVPKTMLWCFQPNLTEATICWFVMQCPVLRILLWFSKNKGLITGSLGEDDSSEMLPRYIRDELIHGRWDIDVHLLRLPDQKNSFDTFGLCWSGVSICRHSHRV